MNAFFGWILQTTWQGAALTGLILLTQWLLGKRLSARGKYALWFLLIARLLLPSLPESSVSVYNLAKRAPRNIEATPAAVTSPIEVAAVTEPMQREETPAKNAPIIKPPTPIDWATGAFWAWAVGAVLLGVKLVWSNARFRRRLIGAKDVSNEEVLGLFAECYAVYKIGEQVRLVESADVESPAVWGLWRSWLLLPQGAATRFSLDELRLIFLHELAHIKRRDLAVNWLAAVLQIAHWFNPVLWLAWRRMKADRELATDALALAHAGESERMAYGETILKVVEGLTGERAMPGLVGIGESKVQLKERLIAIARPGKTWKLAAITAATLVATVGLTDAQTKKPAPDKSTPANIAANDIGPTLTGTVWTPAGKPAPLAQIGLERPEYPLLLAGEALVGTTNNRVRANGRAIFSLPMADTVEELWAADSNGYAILPRESLSNGMRVVLQPWGRIEGVMRLNHALGSNQQIELVQDGNHFGAGRIFAQKETTDGEGKFRFDKVPAGYYSLCRLLESGHGIWSCDPKYLTARSGETTTVAWGGEGRPVKGRFVRQSGNRSAVWFPGESGIPKAATFSVRAEMPWPRPAGLSAAEYWVWRKSEAGLAAFEKFRNYGAYSADDGTFVVDDVAPGIYQFNFAGELSTERLGETRIETAKSMQVTIPELSDPNKCEPFDLGDIEMEPAVVFPVKFGGWSREWEVGAAAPDIEGKTPAGQVLRLKDYRGKYVLLDACGMFPGQETEELEAVARLYAANDKLAILTLYSDANPAVEKRIEQAVGKRWQWGLVNEQTWMTNGLFSAHETPVLLLDPQGKIKAHVPLGSIQATVAAALGKTTGAARPRPNFAPETLTGTVWRPDGKPAPLAQVGLNTATRRLIFVDGLLVSRSENDNLDRANIDGTFTIPTQYKTLALYAASDEGFAIIEPKSLTNRMRINLKPWGSLQGVMQVNHRLATNEEIRLTRDGDLDFAFWPRENPARTDQTGRFRFDRLPEGEYSLCRIERNAKSISAGPPTHVYVRAGATTHFAWGGNGRSGTGKFALTEAASQMPQGSRFKVLISTPSEMPAGLSIDELAQWLQSEAGRRAGERQRCFSGHAGADGTFQIDDVLPGAYEISFQGMPPHFENGAPQLYSEPKRIVIPPFPKQDADQPFDLGSIQTAYTVKTWKMPPQEEAWRSMPQ